MRPTHKIDKLIKNLKIQASPTLDQRIDTLIGQPELHQTRPLNRWRIVMHSKITKYAVAIIIIASFLSLTLLNKTVPQAWAIGQTVDAFKEIKTVELKCYGAGFGNYDAYIRRKGQDWTSFQCLGEREGGCLFGLLEGNMYYEYSLGYKEIYQYDLSMRSFSGGTASKLYNETLKIAPAILPYAKTLLQTFKMLASEWKETYEIDEQTGRESVFVTCIYKPLSMSFEAVFDIETKLVVRAKAWKNSTFEGEPDLVVHEITYNVEILDERFDFEKRFNVPILLHAEKAGDLFIRGCRLENEKPEEAIQIWLELYEKYPNYWQTPEALNAIALLYRKQKQYDNAIAYHQKVLDEYTSPKWAISDAYNMMGYCYKEMNETEKAIESFRKCLEIIQHESVDPKFSERHQAYIKTLETNIQELKRYREG